jgi:signal transduction histidine kinase
LRELSNTMSDMAVRLDAMLVEQREFVADASHQLRTPLTAMRLRLENLQARLPEADAIEVEAAIDETSRLARLVGDLLQLARADGASGQVVVDIAAVADDRVDTWGAVAELQDVRLEVVGAATSVVALAAPGALEQILDNTLDNAMTVTPPGGVVTVVVEPGVTSHRVSVVDHGPGLSDDDKVRALRRFWRGTSTAPGTGLGLAIAQALAGASGGSLALLDTPGGGLTVQLVLPAAR